MMRVGMIGLGNMGTAVGNMIANNGYEVLGWNYEEEVVDEINRSHHIWSSIERLYRDEDHLLGRAAENTRRFLLGMTEPAQLRGLGLDTDGSLWIALQPTLAPDDKALAPLCQSLNDEFGLELKRTLSDPSDLGEAERIWLIPAAGSAGNTLGSNDSDELRKRERVRAIEFFDLN
jgi:hypothetical protein